VTVPADYNAVSLSMTPSEISDTGMALGLAADEIITALNSINATLGDLALGGVGTTATEAKDFVHQWTAAMTNLFGSKKSPSAGVLNQAITTLMVAGGNYQAAETNISDWFNALSSSLTSASSGGANTGPIAAGSDVTDGKLSAVGEINWTALG
jgi:hypothetical protein